MFDTVLEDFYYICKSGNFQLLCCYVNCCGIHVDMRNDNFETPLMHCIINDYPLKTIKTLLFLGANVNATDLSKNTALHFACFHQRTSIVALLLNINDIEINSQNMLGDTPLNIACDYKDINIIKLLLNNPDIDVDLQNYEFGYSSLMKSEYFDDFISQKIVSLSKNVNITDKNKCTPLMYASFLNNEKMVKYLLKYGAEVDLKNNNGRTALMFSSSNGFENICKMLLDHDSDFNLKDNGNCSAIMYAVSQDKKFIVSMMLQKLKK